MKRKLIRMALAFLASAGLTGSASAWGRLPAAEHARAMEKLAEQLPPPQRQAVKQYLQALQGQGQLGLRATDAETAREQSWAVLGQYGKADAKARFDAIWADEARSVVDRVADSIALADADAARLLAEARDASRPAPTGMPALLKDAKRPRFFRANLALAYGKALAQRQVFEEALTALRLVRSGDVVDPAAYYFHRALAEHGLGLKKEAAASLEAVRSDVDGVPSRYQHLAGLMEQEMKGWKDRDLGAAARRMKSASRRLGLARADGTTQKIQHEAVAILDDLIREMQGDGPEGPQPPGPPGPPPPTGWGGPGGGGSMPGDGQLDDKKLRDLAKQWGKLPPQDRARIMAGIARDVLPEYREVVERYFKRLAQSETPAR